MQNKTAILYSRVSTQDQKDHGYSLDEQERQMRRFCQGRKIEIVATFTEDHTAKTFERPIFQQILRTIKKKQLKCDYLLVHQWDRFSRNLADAIIMITELRSRNVEVQSINGWSDYQNPDHLLLLAISLASGEVDNVKRSNRTRDGMRSAKKSGRWMGTPPRGYKSVRDSSGKPLLCPSEDAQTIKSIFADFVSGLFTVDELYAQYRRKAFKCSKSNFHRILSNPVYKGFIVVPASGAEPEQLVRGLHEPLVSEEVYERVQIIRHSIKKGVKAYYKEREGFPLRGMLFCPRCSRKLTGSLSKGNGGKYQYYHCRSSCGFRLRSSEADGILVQYLGGIKPPMEVALLYRVILMDQIRGDNIQRNNELRIRRADLAKLNDDICDLTEALIKRKINQDSYQKLFAKYTKRELQLKFEISELEGYDKDVARHIEFALELFQKLDSFYQNASFQIKRQIIGSIFSGKLIIERQNCRTVVSGSLAEQFSTNFGQLKGLTQKERGSGFQNLRKVTPTGLEPVQPP